MTPDPNLENQRMTYNPETAERAAQVMESVSISLRLGSKRANDAAALLRSQADEIERLSVYEQYDQCTCGQSCPLHPNTPPAEPAGDELRRAVEDLIQAAEALLRRDEVNTCPHEETYRGGILWEICHSCGMKWADDEGGRPDWTVPPEWEGIREAIRHARAALAAAPAPIQPAPLTEPAEDVLDLMVAETTRVLAGFHWRGVADEKWQDAPAIAARKVRAVLATAPAPQPEVGAGIYGECAPFTVKNGTELDPQPETDGREAMIAVIAKLIRGNISRPLYMDGVMGAAHERDIKHTAGLIVDRIAAGRTRNRKEK